MTVKIQAQREKIQALSRQANAMLADKGDRWTADDQTAFNSLADQITQAENVIKNEEVLRKVNAEAFFEDAKKHSKGPEVDAVAAVGVYLRHGTQGISQEQAIAIRNAMSTTTGSEGGYTVPSEVAAMVVDALKNYGGMREVAQILTTASGNPLSYPTSDGTSEVGEIVAENAAATGADITFGTVSVNPYKYSSKKIALPWELVQDSAIDVVQFVVDRLATRIGRITNTHYTTGDGSSKPYGVMARASSGKVGVTGHTTTVTYADLIDLIHSVNSAYRRRARLMLADSSLAVLRKMVDTTGRPIWTPGDAESITNGIPGTLCGYQYTVNNDVAAMAANAKSIAFGDFGQFVIRDVAGSFVIRRFDDSAFALNGQVGFCGWTRTGSNLLDTAAVKYYQNSAS